MSRVRIFDLKKDVLANQEYHKVLYNDGRMEMTTMSILPNQGIEREIHDVTQFTCVIEGAITCVINDKHQGVLGPGNSVIIPAGTTHQFLNNSPSTVKLYTIYAPAEEK